MFTTHQVQTERLEKWLSPLYWIDCNLQSVLFSKDHQQMHEIDELLVYEPLDSDQRISPTSRICITVREAIEVFTCHPSSYRVAKIGENFGPGWSTKWFRLRVKFPTTCLEKGRSI